MANQKTKLELTWIGKENRPKLEPRILLEDQEKSYHASHRITGHDVFDTRLIMWDNESNRMDQATSSCPPWSELTTEWRQTNE